MARDPVMYMRVTGGSLQRGCWERYEEAHSRFVSLAPAIGLVGRWLGRDIEHPDTVFSFSLWTSREHMETYERSDSIRREILPHLAPLGTGLFEAHHCEVRFGEIYSAEATTPDSRQVGDLR